MSDQVVRLLIVAGVLLGAVAIAAIATKFKAPVHPTIKVGDIGDRPGVVLFTSTDCGTCKEAISVLKEESVTFREVTYDLEPHRFETWTVFAVPLTVVLDADGEVREMMSGVPSRRRLRRALSAAGMVVS